MRKGSWMLLLVVLLSPLVVRGGPEDSKKDKPQKTVIPPKPGVRSIQLKSQTVLFDVRLRPGAPDPREMVEITMEMAEVPAVPDPIYGERIPIKAAEIVAEVTDVDGAGYTLAYRVHRLQDAGSYGFHFTPMRKDNYVVTFKGAHKGRAYKTKFRAPVGIWPFTRVDDKGNISQVEARTATSRLPAVPAGMKTPAQPGSQAGSSQAPAGLKVSPLLEGMRTLGDLWARSGMVLLTGRKPNLGEAKGLADALYLAAGKASKAPSSDADYSGLMDELQRAAEAFRNAAQAGKPTETIKAFEHLGSHHCNRCHFKMRWGVLDDLAGFPAELP